MRNRPFGAKIYGFDKSLPCIRQCQQSPADWSGRLICSIFLCEGGKFTIYNMEILFILFNFKKNYLVGDSK